MFDIWGSITLELFFFWLRNVTVELYHMKFIIIL